MGELVAGRRRGVVIGAALDRALVVLEAGAELRLDEARHWLKRACQAGQKEHIKMMALADDDLRPLWPEIPEF